MTTVSLAHVSEKPWSEFTKTDYTPEQWHRACLIHLHDGETTSKDQCKLPVRTPGGAISRPGVHAAAAALAGARGGVNAPEEAKNKAAKALIRYYHEFDENPPESLVKHTEEGGDPMANTIDVEDFLEHYGVRGMKWGVHNGEVREGANRKERKAAKKESKLAYKSWKKEVGSEKVANEIFQEATKSFNKDVKILNNDPAFKGKDLTTNPRLRRQYDNAVSDTFNMRMADASVARTLTNTGRAMIYQFDSSVGMMRAQESQLVYHADDDSPWPDFVAEMDSLGHVISLRRADDDDELLEQAEEMAERILEHYGVPGMKWGVRKSPREAVSEAKSRVRKELKERTDTETHVRAKPGQLVRVVGGNKRAPHEDAVKARTSEQVAKRSTLDALSNKDLQHLVQRMNLEKQYRDMAVKETRKSAVQKWVENLITSDKGDKYYEKLGPHALVGKKVVQGALNMVTQNKAMLGGVVSDKKKNKDKE